MDCCKPEKNGDTRIWNFEIRIPVLEEEKVPAKNARGWKVEGLKRRVTREEDKRLREELEVRGVMAQKRAIEYCQEENVGRQRRSTQRTWKSTAGT